MARKVRRVKGTASKPAETPIANKSATPSKAAVPDEKTLREEYSYVIKDLRRVFMLAGVMFLLLIALNLLL
jgi:hypothetical protein